MNTAETEKSKPGSEVALDTDGTLVVTGTNSDNEIKAEIDLEELAVGVDGTVYDFDGLGFDVLYWSE